MKAYKVVQRCGDNTVISAGEMKSQYRYTYRLDKTNHPAFANSKFFVFRDIHKSKTFLNRLREESKNLELWEVSSSGLKKINYGFPIWSSSLLEKFVKYWQNKRLDDPAPLTKGAYQCSSVKFIKRVL